MEIDGALQIQRRREIYEDILKNFILDKLLIDKHIPQKYMFLVLPECNKLINAWQDSFDHPEEDEEFESEFKIFLKTKLKNEIEEIQRREKVEPVSPNIPLKLFKTLSQNKKNFDDNLNRTTMCSKQLVEFKVKNIELSKVCSELKITEVDILQIKSKLLHQKIVLKELTEHKEVPEAYACLNQILDRCLEEAKTELNELKRIKDCYKEITRNEEYNIILKQYLTIRTKIRNAKELLS